MAAVLSNIQESDLIVHTKKDNKSDEYVVIETSKKNATVRNTVTGELKRIKYYQGSWKMKGGLLQKKLD